ncbi:PRC-barrel domain-containing protein [Halomonas sp. Bachu 37]|uniref:PRC-barrel domain-containing protein n=1 Tax=Halomonas kashgarensis TaxID=3084920 RepID=UPI003217C258
MVHLIVTYDVLEVSTVTGQDHTSESLMDAEVFGESGEEIGNVENVLINQDNQIVAIIAEVGGFWGIGATHVLVPWEEVQLTDDGVQVPIVEDNVDDYDLFDSGYISQDDLSQTEQARQVDDDVETGDRIWKLTDLLDDYASFNNRVGYGYIDNILFSREGEIQAIVIHSAGNFGNAPYAYPFYGYGYGWAPGNASYMLQYEENEIGDMDVFDYREYNGMWDDDD